MAANYIAAETPVETKSAGLEQRVKVATDLLEDIARDRVLLAEIVPEDRTRLQRAAGQVYCPEPEERRRLLKAAQRRQKARRRQQDQAVVGKSGIRELRRKPVFTTPNVVAPVESVMTSVRNPPYGSCTPKSVLRASTRLLPIA